MTASSPRYRVGELRPSQILFSFGVGAIVDLPQMSAMVMGLEDWNLQGTIELSEERLLAAVRQHSGSQVQKLLSPPLLSDSDSQTQGFDRTDQIGLPVAPFPSWLVCPECRLLANVQSGLFELKPDRYRPDKTYYIHHNCTKSRNPKPALPARFLVACDRGHLDDFPWRYFVHHGNSSCSGSLRLYEKGLSGTAADIIVYCDGCKQSRKLVDAFGELAEKNMPACRGRHPHLRTFDDKCDRQMTSILLGASNSWFPINFSALSIPSTSVPLMQLVNAYWKSLSKANSQEKLTTVLEVMQAEGRMQEFLEYPIADIWQIVQQKQADSQENHTEVKDLKTPEWQVFTTADPNYKTKEFQQRAVDPPKGYERWFEKTVLVERLREVRALVGFTRLQSPGDFTDPEDIPEESQVRLSRSHPTWIPATEVKGEGIFLQFREDTLQQWEQQKTTIKRSNFCREDYKSWCNQRSINPDTAIFPGLRYILLHSLSHALMRQLALECGYNSASLQERIYCQLPSSEEDTQPQAGILIYTASPDSEGTLGGLVSLGEPATLGYHIFQSLETMRLCASDPLCAEHVPEGTTLHWAACHACQFCPETSCERGNRFLDRSLLVATMHRNDLAFFQYLTSSS